MNSGFTGKARERLQEGNTYSACECAGIGEFVDGVATHREVFNTCRLPWKRRGALKQLHISALSRRSAGSGE